MTSAANDPFAFGDAYLNEQVARRYADQHKRQSRRLSHWREARVIARLLGPSRQNGLLLDAPCGAGRFTGALLGLGYRVVSLDRAPTMAAQARAASDTGVVTGSLASLPFEDDSFEAVLCARFFHHIAGHDEKVACFRELARVAQRVVVASAWVETRFTKWRRERKPRTGTRHLVTPDELQGVLAEAGLEETGRQKHIPVWAPTTYFRLVPGR